MNDPVDPAEIPAPPGTPLAGHPPASSRTLGPLTGAGGEVDPLTGTAGYDGNCLALLSVLDTGTAGVAIILPGSGSAHASPTMRQLLEGSGEAERLWAEVLALASHLDSPAHASRCAGLEDDERREFPGSRERYVLRGCRFAVARDARESVVFVVVTRDRAGTLTDGQLKARYRLTRREIEVARLLAEGRSNQGIAAAMSISPHTTRHHTERVLFKLDVRSRAEVAARLLQG